MPIVECKDCKTKVSTSAETCPTCGARYPASYIPSKVIVHRTSSVISFAVKMVVYADEEKMGELWGGDTINFELLYGTHKIKIKAKAIGGTSREFMVRILPANTYRIETSFSLGGVNFESYVSET